MKKKYQFQAEKHTNFLEKKRTKNTKSWQQVRCLLCLFSLSLLHRFNALSECVTVSYNNKQTENHQKPTILFFSLSFLSSCFSRFSHADIRVEIDAFGWWMICISVFLMCNQQNNKKIWVRKFIDWKVTIKHLCIIRKRKKLRDPPKEQPNQIHTFRLINQFKQRKIHKHGKQIKGEYCNFDERKKRKKY